MNQALLLACSLEVAPLHRSCMLIHIVTHMLFRRVLGTAYTTAPAQHGPVSQCQTSSCKLNRVHAVPDNLQGFEGHDSSASHSNPTGRGYCTVKKPEGLTSRMDSHSTIYLPFSQPQSVRVPGFKICTAALAMKRVTIKGSLRFGVLIPLRTTSSRYRT